MAQTLIGLATQEEFAFLLRFAILLQQSTAIIVEDGTNVEGQAIER